MSKVVSVAEYDAILEALKAEGKRSDEVSEEVINRRLLLSYEESKDMKNPRIDIHDLVWEHEVEAITEALSRAEVKEFTISQWASNLLKNLAVWQELGVVVEGTVYVNNRYNEKPIPALLLKIKQA
jgi:hypothetical protein